jgi:hypothetical protein
MVLASQSQDGVLQSRKWTAGTQGFGPVGPEYLILELFAIEDGVNRVQLFEVSYIFKIPVCQRGTNEMKCKINPQSTYNLTLSSGTCSISDGFLKVTSEIEDRPWARSCDRMTDLMVSTSSLSRSFSNRCDKEWIRGSGERQGWN